MKPLMTTTELARRLAEEGCNASNYSINTRSYDGYCLLRDRLQWAVFYSERGQDHPPIFTSADESAACAFFLGFVLNMRHDHCVGELRSAQAAQALQARLALAGVKTHIDRMLYARNDYRHRVFVTGKDVFEARRMLGKLPLTDAEDPKPGFWRWLFG